MLTANRKIFDKNTNYTVVDITNAVLTATDRYKDFESARGTVSQMITKLGIKSVNGQKRNRYFSGKDAQRVFDSIPHLKQIRLIEPELTSGKAQKDSLSKLICLETTRGSVYVRQEDISMITLPPVFYFLIWRGYGSIVTLRTGRKLHVKEEMDTVRRLIKDASEVMK